MCSVKLVRVVCRLTSGWGSTLISSHSEKCGAEGAKGDHTHWLGSRDCLLDSLIGSVPETAVSLRLLHCSMQRMIAIIRIVVRSNPIDAMRSSNIMVCVLYDNFRSTRFELRGFHQFFVFGSAVDHEIQTRGLLAKWQDLTIPPLHAVW